jgi:hypothetical protein
MAVDWKKFDELGHKALQERWSIPKMWSVFGKPRMEESK